MSERSSTPLRQPKKRECSDMNIPGVEQHIYPVHATRLMVQHAALRLSRRWSRINHGIGVADRDESLPSLTRASPAAIREHIDWVIWSHLTSARLTMALSGPRTLK
jgi:hypothetical protein